MPKNLTVRVLIAIALGALCGALLPGIGIEFKILSDIFVRLVKMVVAPIVFLTIVVGMARMGDLKKVGVLGVKALTYFEIATTAALGTGVALALLLRPGEGFDIAHMHARMADVPLPAPGPPPGWRETVLNLVPDSVVGAFSRGDMLQVLVFAVLFGAALSRQGEAAGPWLRALDRVTALFFATIDLIMRASPLAAFGAMAFTVGEYGLDSLWSLGKLLLVVLAAMVIFVGGVLGAVARASGFRLGRLVAYLRAELLLVLGTSSSESALPSIMEKLEAGGCSRAVVGLVVPTGYAFNLDGTAIYLSTAVLFIAQAYGIDLTWEQLATTLGILMVTSKGAAGVSGSGLITLAATLAALPGRPVPPEGIALVIGVDRFMSAARALTNLLGNCVATVVLAKVEGAFTDRQKF